MDLGGMSAVAETPDFGAVADAAGAAGIEMPELSLEAMCGDLLKPLTDAKEQLGALTATLDQPKDAVSKLGDINFDGLSGDASPLGIAKTQLTELTMTVQKAGNTPAKELISGSPIAGCWVSSIKKKLTEFADSVKTLADSAAELAGELGSQLADLLAKLKAFGEAFVAKLGELAKVAQDSIDAITDAVSDIEKMKCLGDILTGIKDAMRKLLFDLQDKVDIVTVVINKVSEYVKNNVTKIVEQLATFVKASPKKVVDSFKPPLPLGCIGKVGEIKATLDSTVATVSGLIDTAALTKAVEGFFTAMPDLKGIMAPVDGFEEAILAQLKPVEESVSGIVEMVDSKMPTAVV